MIQQIHSHKKVNIINIQITELQWTKSFYEVFNTLCNQQCRIYFANAHCIVTAQDHQQYAKALSQAEFIFNDGIGMDLAKKILWGEPFPDNLNGTDWIPTFLSLVEQKEAEVPLSSRLETLFFLGSTPEVINTIALIGAQRWPHLKILGTHHGFFPNDESIVEKIKNLRPKILIVGMGVPLQEIFIDTHWEELKQAGVQAAIAGGAVIDFISQKVPRAPQWMRNQRLEWLYRLWIEPCRLWKRYFFGIPRFLLLLATHRKEIATIRKKK